MSWDINLVFSDGKSNKFWRARKDGGDLVVNWGRVGTDGQTQVKNLGSASQSEAELQKLAKSKRKKGYEDTEGESKAKAEPEVIEAEPALVDEISLVLDSKDGRRMQIKLQIEGEDSVKTTVTEKFTDKAEARQAFERVRQSMKDSGYKEGSA